MSITRRAFLKTAAAALPALAATRVSIAATKPATWDFGAVMDMAEALSRAPHSDPQIALPASLESMTYDQYQNIQFKPEKALFKDANSAFTVDLFHSGFNFHTPVGIDLVENDIARALPFNTELFDYGSLTAPAKNASNLYFSGFRARNAFNRPDVMDEFVVFHGASYFRAIAKGQHYGLSARGLALNTAEQSGEEFPRFRRFWLIRPQPGANSMVAFALLDSPSTTGAYRFTLRPGETTITDVELVLFPRVDLNKVGLAPLTSMFMFNGLARSGHDDSRPAVHDSNGLQILTGTGERILRPLANPSRLQVSAFLDRNPRGFGLVQRARAFSEYQDIDSRFELRPSTWVEPIGDWGAGALILVEIPSDEETNDNIVAFWRPNETIRANRPYNLTYRLHWCDTPPDPAPLAKAVTSRGGLSFDKKRRQFVVDFADMPAAGSEPEVSTFASAGKISNVAGRHNPFGKTFRVTFELDTGDESLIELRLALIQAGRPISETWLYRWTRP
jgi:glucans biosynthesis protein